MYPNELKVSAIAMFLFAGALAPRTGIEAHINRPPIEKFVRIARKGANIAETSGA